jgi:hypothetical protein
MVAASSAAEDARKEVPMGQQDDTDLTVNVFYRTGRAGVVRLSDGGGPFGFDIAVALLVDEIIRGYRCVAFAETGCFAGDTTSYLARRYPGLPVYACDIDPGSAAFTARRLMKHTNAVVTCEDAPLMLARVGAAHARPLAYLDAHWGDRWPLADELNTLTAAGGIAVIHDFDIGHDRFGYDTYDGIACGPALLARMPNPPDRYYVLDPSARLPVPCLQTGRRAGVGVVIPRELGYRAPGNPYLAERILAMPAGTRGAR